MNLWNSRPHGARRRRAAAALEFAITCPLLFLVFLGMVEIARAMMAAGALANAARAGARAGAVTGGSYSAAAGAVATALSDANLPSSGAATVTVNGVVVTDDDDFKAAAVPGATIAVKAALPYSSISWLPGGGSFFLPPSQSIAAVCEMSKEG
jgi:Flp pilus assembly protein TadG